MLKRRRERPPGANEDITDATAAEAARVATELSEAEDLPEAEGLAQAAAEAAADVRADLAGAVRQERGSRQVTGAIEAARAGMARQSSRVARRASERTAIVAQTAGRRTQGAADTAGRGTRAARRGMSSGLTWMTSQVVAMGPRLKVRDRDALRLKFPGRSDDEIADLLVERAGRAAAAVGGATGAWAALPVLPAFPAEIAAETLAVVGIEIKLVAELHEVLGLPAQGNVAEKARAYIAAWANRRGIFAIHGGFVLAAGSPLARLLRRRLAARVTRSAFSLAPLLTGAVAGAILNRRETRRLGHEVLRDLRRHQRETIKSAVITD
ncbi:MAG TPA: hypothetical protein VH478_15930 [Trebonia sp.]|jgi:hypothetical protein|nr:hypothetical protein [Trebonia sp.]